MSNSNKLQHLNKGIIGGIALIILVAPDAALATATSLTSCDVDLPLIDQLIDFLPKSPEDLKLANILTEFAMEAPIGSGLIFEAYSSSFQLLGLLAFFKSINILASLKKLLF